MLDSTRPRGVASTTWLRERTAEAHRGAEGSAFVARFVRGGLDRDMFSRHMLALHGVYAALEDAFERLKDEPRLGAFVLPQLWRRLALERDLDFLRGPHWRSEEPVAAARAYADRLRWIEENQPIRLVSHSYVRYLGDLSGGQMLKGLAARQLELDGDGLRFYEFPAITIRWCSRRSIAAASTSSRLLTASATPSSRRRAPPSSSTPLSSTSSSPAHADVDCFRSQGEDQR